MDLDLLRTFLEVHRTRHFGRASRSLFITQSAISTRIKQLEDILGVKLFTRKRDDIQLTPAGKRLLPAAEALMGLWEQTRKHILIDEPIQLVLGIGTQPILGELILPRWITALQNDFPTLSLRCEQHQEASLLQALQDKTLDVVLLLDPPKSKDFLVWPMNPVTVIMVASRPDIVAHAAVHEHHDTYILVDWGRSFLQEHARYFPDAPLPGLQTDLSRMAKDWLLRQGGTACLDQDLVADEIQANRLFPVQDGLSHTFTPYAIYAGKTDKSHLIKQAISRLV